jgi:hypothetical protein
MLEFASVAEMKDHYKNVRDRLNPKPTKALPAVEPEPEPEAPAAEAVEPVQPESEYLTTSEAAHETRFAQQTIRNWCRDHGIAERHGGRWMVVRKRLYDLIATINCAPLNSHQDRIRHELEMRKAASLAESMFNRIVASVGLEWMVTHDEMMSPRRQERIVRARQVAMYLAIKLTTWSLPRIARRFHKDHTTVMHARDRIEEMRNSHPDIADRVSRLEAELTRGPA